MFENVTRHTETAPSVPEKGEEILDLANELTLLYARTNEALDLCLNNPNLDPTKLSALINSTTTILAQLVKLKTDMYNVAQVQRMERAMIMTMKGHKDAETLLNTFESYLNEA